MSDGVVLGLFWLLVPVFGILEEVPNELCEVVYLLSNCVVVQSSKPHDEVLF